MVPMNVCAGLVVGIVLLSAECGRRLEAAERAPGFALPGLLGGEVKFEPPAAAPAPTDPASVLVFIDPAQEQSLTALSDLRDCLGRMESGAARVRSLAIVSGAPDAAAVESLKARLPERGPVTGVLDPQRTAYEAYGVIALPTTFVVDPAGIIAAVLPGRSAGYGQRLEAALRTTLGLPPAREAGPAESAETRKVQRLRKLAAELAAERRYAEAAKLLEEARALLPGDAELAVAHGEALLDVPDAAGAAAAFRRAQEIAPALRAAKAGIAKAAALGDDVETAEKLLREVTRVPGADPGCSYYLGRVLERRAEFQGAAAAYREAFERLRRGR